MCDISKGVTVATLSWPAQKYTKICSLQIQQIEFGENRNYLLMFFVLQMPWRKPQSIFDQRRDLRSAELN
jgi:hypothetical protein